VRVSSTSLWQSTARFVGSAESHLEDIVLKDYSGSLSDSAAETLVAGCGRRLRCLSGDGRGQEGVTGSEGPRDLLPARTLTGCPHGQADLLLARLSIYVCSARFV